MQGSLSAKRQGQPVFITKLVVCSLSCMIKIIFSVFISVLIFHFASIRIHFFLYGICIFILNNSSWCNYVAIGWFLCLILMHNLFVAGLPEFFCLWDVSLGSLIISSHKSTLEYRSWSLLHSYHRIIIIIISSSSILWWVFLVFKL